MKGEEVMDDTINVALEDGSTARCAPYTILRALAKSGVSKSGLPYIAAMVNNEVSSLSYPLTADSSLRFLTLEDPHGWHVYRNSLSFVLAMAVNRLYPQARFCVHHSFGTGLYCTFESEDRTSGAAGIGAQQLQRIEDLMRDIAARDLPIARRKLSYMQAVDHFERNRLYDKLNLLKFRNPPRIVIHACEGFSDLAHSPLADRTGSLRVFRLIHYPPGFVLQLPDRQDPRNVAPFQDQPHLFRIFQEHKEWGRILGVTTAGRLNEIVASREVREFIRVSEALHEKKIAAIADQILAHRQAIKLILIAGPSCAGKTTFSKRLAIQLRVNGLRPVTLGTDDYFVDEDRTPRDENDAYDFEHMDAVDIKLFNEHLLNLLAGEEVEVPRYDFDRKCRMNAGRKLRLTEDEIIIVEGIHGLNPRLTSMVPADRKFKIYVNSLTQLALDSNNRIATTDNRLTRRIVRDNTFRGNSPLATLRMWPSVRRGEKRWIFPFQGEAQATFNSALEYELSVLKPMVEPLLLQIKPSEPEYAEARRLSAFLSNFLAVSDGEVPGTSILREYIGGSNFEY